MNAYLIYHLGLGFTLVLIGLLFQRFSGEKSNEALFNTANWCVLAGIVMIFVQAVLVAIFGVQKAFIIAVCIECLLLLSIVLFSHRIRLH